ncbi:MAG: SDR family NAD(P)-dependent oxidoreductase, partial [Pseudomonadota bacterium]
MKIEGSTILVTGANRGIGLALVEKSLAKGAARVYATYRAAENRPVLEGLGERVIPIQLDLGDTNTIAQLGDAVP